MKRKYFALVMVTALGAPLVYAQNGESLYGQCAACHGAQGGGGSGPALAGDQNLEKAPYVINRILHGGGGMPAYDSLSNGEVAAVASYIRSSFGNSYGQVSAKQVAAQRGGSQSLSQTQQNQSQGQKSQPVSTAQNSASSPLAATKAVQLEVSGKMATKPFDTTRTLNVPKGFGISVYARLPNARFMALTPEGDLLVSQPDEGKISRLTAGQGGSATVSDFLTGLTRPHDMVFYQLNGKTYLFVAESDQISRFTYQAGSATNEQVVVAGLPDADPYRHPLKSLAIDGNNTLYVMTASSTNAGPEDLSAEPKRGAIYTFDVGVTGADVSTGQLFAQGLRNAEGLDFVPNTNDLWVVVNNRDQLAYPFHKDFDGDDSDDYGKVLQGYVDNHPPDEFTQVVKGGHYGWPFCNPYPNTENGYNDMPFNRDVETNPEGQFDCAQANRINQGIQSHSAPLGLLFLQDTAFPDAYQGAVTPLHGSWNREVPTGYKVVYFPWQNGAPGDQLDLVTGWLPQNAQNGGEAWGRPVDAAVDAQGNMFISDDASGTVYKLSPETQNASN